MLHYSIRGEGKPLVLIHGFLESSSMWNVLNLESHFKCIYFELPGHGSSPVQHAYELESVADQMINVLRKEGVEDYVAIGHSMGGYVGLELLHQDSYCQRLILLNSNYWSDDEKKALDRHRIAEFVVNYKRHFIYESIPHLFLNPELHEQEIKELIAEATHMKASGIAEASIAMSKRRDFSSVPEIIDKVDVIQGRQDTIVPIDRMLEEKRIGDQHLHVIDQSAHMSHLEQTESTRSLILGLLKKDNGN